MRGLLNCRYAGPQLWALLRHCCVSGLWNCTFHVLTSRRVSTCCRSAAQSKLLPLLGKRCSSVCSVCNTVHPSLGTNRTNCPSVWQLGTIDASLCQSWNWWYFSYCPHPCLSNFYLPGLSFLFLLFFPLLVSSIFALLWGREVRGTLKTTGYLRLLLQPNTTSVTNDESYSYLCFDGLSVDLRFVDWCFDMTCV